MENKRLEAKSLLKKEIEAIASKGVSKRIACIKISKLFRNKWTPKYLYHVAYRDHIPGKKLARAILNIPSRKRRPQLWIKVPCDTEEQKARLLQVPPRKRLEAVELMIKEMEK